MFSKEESKRIREEFGTSFGQEYSRKWILYNTKIKEIQFKFSFDRKKAMVSLDIDAEDELIQAYYFEKIQLSSKYLIQIYLKTNVLTFSNYLVQFVCNLVF